MRLFTDSENIIIKELVEVKSRGIKAIQYLQTAKILKEQFDFFALKWTVGTSPSISIYNRHTEDSSKIEEYNQLYFKVADYIYFLKELESLGFIAIQTITKKQEREYSLLYDRKKYKYDENKNEFIPINEHPIDTSDFIKGDTPPFEEVSPGFYTLLQVDRHEINLDFANDLERYGLGIIYPLPLAVDYVNNGFQTLERLQYNKQMDTALDSAKSGRRAANWGVAATIIAVLALIATIVSFVITIRNSQKPTTIDRLDLERIETAIRNNHISEPIEIITNDTLVIKQIKAVPKNQNNNKRTNEQSVTIPGFDNR